jgi:hypothetical protein
MPSLRIASISGVRSVYVPERYGIA